jgi:DNA-binding transcriptional LysR family regulator
MIREKKSSPRGTLRIIAGTGALETILENLPVLTNKYPELDFKFLSITDVFQFQIGDADVGIVPVLFSDPDIVQHHLLDGLLKVYASPSYLKEKPPPQTLEDLYDHKIIIYDIEDDDMYKSHNILPLTMEKNASCRHHIKLNSGNAIRTALLNGLGLGTFIYTRDLVETRLLVDVFPHLPPRKVPYYITYHKRLMGSPKIQAFHEFMKEIAKVWVPPKK